MWHSKFNSFHSPLIHTVNFCECQKIKWETVNAVSILGDMLGQSPQHETVIFSHKYSNNYTVTSMLTGTNFNNHVPHGGL